MDNQSPRIDSAELAAATDAPSIVGLGEVLWDVFPDGAKFGGAPANFACSAAGIGDSAVKVSMVSAVGTDSLGQQAIAALQQHAVNTNAVATVDHPTGQVWVTLDDDGKANYKIATGTAWDNVMWSNTLAQVAETCDATCFGTLGQRSQISRETIRQFIAATHDDCLRVFDINLRPPFFDDEIIDQSLRMANVIKLNEDELSVLAERYPLSGDATRMAWQLQELFQLECVALTLGADGAILIRDDETCQIDGQQVDVVDTVGAGDAFTAALTLGLLGGADLQSIGRHATEVAGFVCTQSGATPSIPAKFRA